MTHCCPFLPDQFCDSGICDSVTGRKRLRAVTEMVLEVPQDSPGQAAASQLPVFASCFLPMKPASSDFLAFNHPSLPPMLLRAGWVLGSW